MNKVEEYSIEVWKEWSNKFAYLIPLDEIRQYVIPNINPETYFEIHKERLAWDYNLDEDEITIEDVNWDREQGELGELHECAVALNDFDEEFAKSRGYYMPEPSDEIFEVWHYLDSGSNWQAVWKEYMESTSTYNLTDDSVSLDEWDERNWRTGRMGVHEEVHRIIDGSIYDEGYIILRHSQWSGEQSEVVAEGLSLEGVLNYIENINDGMERDLEYYRNNLLEL